MLALLATVLLNAAFWSGVSAFVSGRIRHDWVDQVFATAVAGFALMIVSLEILGLAHQISSVSVAAVCLATGLLGLWWRRRAHSEVALTTASLLDAGRQSTSWESAPAIVALGLAVWAALVYLLLGMVFPVEPISDAPIYHLHFAARWLKSGSLDLVPTPFGAEEAAHFPANGDLWLTWLMATGAYGSLVKVGQWPFLVLGAAALYGLARRTRVPWPAAIFPAALWIGLPIVLTQSSLANVDLIWTAFYLIAIYFLLEWLDDAYADDRIPLFFFALASGIVIGAKTVGAVFVALLLLPLLAVLARRPRRLSQLAWLGAGLFVPAAFWYARNVWLTGNPLYPVQLSFFGHVWAEGWYRPSAMNATAYHLPVTAWRIFLARLRLVAGSIGLVVVIAGLVAGWIRALRSSREASARRALAMYSTLALAQGVIYWCVLPYNTQERFLSPALGLALIPLSPVAAIDPLVSTGLCVLLGSQFAYLFHNPLGLGNPWLTLLLPASLLAAAISLKWAPPARWFVAGLIVTIGCYLSARPAATALATEPLLAFYPHTGFAASLFPGWEILERARAPTGSRIAYAGTNLPYYLLGVGLRNEVEYINVNGHPGWLPHDYHRLRSGSPEFRLAEDPWPQWYRSEADFNAWVANLHQRRIDFLFIARENRHGRLEARPGELPRFPIERQWADAHPELFADLGPFHYASGSIPWVRVYRLTPVP